MPPEVAKQLAVQLKAELLLLEGLSHTPMIETLGNQVIDGVTNWMQRHMVQINRKKSKAA